MQQKSLNKVVFTSLVVVAMLSLIILTGVVAGGQSEDETSLIVTANTVAGHAGVPEGQICVLESKFQPGQMIVWRTKVYDPETGEAMGDEELRYVTIKLPDGESFEAEYGGHPPEEPTDYFWAASWTIPDDYPTGSLHYKIEARAKDGRTGEFTEFEVKPSMLTIVAGEEG